MAFERGTKRPAQQITQDESELEENQNEESNLTQHEESRPEETPVDESNPTLKPLLSEVESQTKTTGKNPGGAKKWTCKHCKKTFTSSYTRIHYHFLGAPPGKKSTNSKMSSFIDE